MTTFPSPQPGAVPVPNTTLDTYDPDAVLLDVREPGEFAAGHAPGSLHIPFGQLADRLDEIPPGPIVVTCSMGGRASRATAALRSAGRDAVNLRGGLRGWVDSGRPIVAERAGEPQII